jgi:dCMP deaminase
MILDDLRQRFLIIGITGPLRSGCTTTAEFLKGTLNTAIRRSSFESENYNDNIFNSYDRISSMKADSNLSDDQNKNRALQKMRNHLLKNIKYRQVLNILRQYKEDKIKYISLTDMLIKAAVEEKFNGLSKGKLKIPILSKEEAKKNARIITAIKRSNDKKIKNCKEIIKVIKEQGFLSKTIRNRTINQINENLRYRNYAFFSPIHHPEEFEDHIKLFDDYLIRINKLKSDFKNAFQGKFGRIRGSERLRDVLQDMGDNIRRCGNPFDYQTPFDNINNNCLWTLSEHANNVVKYHKNKFRLWDKDSPQYKQSNIGPHIFVLESFRNPIEAEYFRFKYYEFYLISLSCDRDIRFLRYCKTIRDNSKDHMEHSTQLKYSFKNSEDRDEGSLNKKSEIYKQNVRGTVALSDLTLKNNETKKELYKKILVYYSLIRQPGCFEPSNDEMFMQAAYSMSLRSRCISRKVGAIIVGENGYIIGGGWNDVSGGQIGCGGRTINDVNKFGNVYMPLEVKDVNIFKEFLITKYQDHPNFSFCYRSEYELFKTGIRDDNSTVKQQQYCRALHAEENALLQTAKIGGMGVRNGTLYTTTFPCELCAKKIYQSGIRKIIYNDPYPESLSEEIIFNDGIRTIIIEPFEGVKSHSYYRLFKPSFDKKDYQNISVADRL